MSHLKQLAYGILLIVLTGSAGHGDAAHRRIMADGEARFVEYEGVLTGAAGEPLAGDYEMTFRLYDAPGSPAVLWEEAHRVTVTDGAFRVTLGRSMRLPAAGDHARYIAVSVGGEELGPRQAFRVRSRAGGAGTDGSPGAFGDQAPPPDPLAPGVVGTPTLTPITGGGGGWVDDGTVVRLDAATDSVGIGTSTPTTVLEVIGADASNSVALVRNTAGGPALRAEGLGSSSGTAYGTYGYAENIASGYAYGGYFVADSLGSGSHYGVAGVSQGSGNFSVGGIDLGTNSGPGGGFGTFGIGSNTGPGEAYGGYFSADSSGTGTHYGVRSESYGVSDSTAYGTYSIAQNSGSGDTYGGLFNAFGAGTGDHYGVQGLSFGESGNTVVGVNGWGQNTAGGPAYGGYLVAPSWGTGTHYGLRADGYGSSSSFTYGTAGFADNTSSGTTYGGYFTASSNGTGIHYGLRAESYGASSSDIYGSYGYADNASSARTYGGYFRAGTSGTGTHYGVYGTATGNSGSSLPVIGVYGFGSNGRTSSRSGGFFAIASAQPGTGYGVQGLEDAGGTGAAVYAAGDQIASGTKSAVVRTAASGHRLMYTVESSEVWFEDVGEGRLVEGRVHVPLDPLFRETVTVDADHPLRVFVQLEGDCNGTWVKKGLNGFDVIELQGGTSDAPFSYRVLAKRKGYETERIRETDVGYDDPNLYPELWAQIEAQQDELMERDDRERAAHDGERAGMGVERMRKAAERGTTAPRPAGLSDLPMEVR